MVIVFRHERHPQRKERVWHQVEEKLFILKSHLFGEMVTCLHFCNVCIYY